MKINQQIVGFYLMRYVYWMQFVEIKAEQNHGRRLQIIEGCIWTRLLNILCGFWEWFRTWFLLMQQWTPIFSVTWWRLRNILIMSFLTFKITK
ncbi:hypothetical protein HanHA300_Chr16g0621701 [Helianthus annuus]|nr:hypothetical protein HanHA300_Chr16g0621701 [Helianthus annuus]KAJ0461467.1 hypothetical protein HanHA89_Chr16g0672601 [Helianthus annuus]